MSDPVAMLLPLGLAKDRVAQLGDLIAEITAGAVTSLPYLAPALLFADGAVQARIGMPVAAPHEILVQDYQAVDYAAGLPLDTALQTSCLSTVKGGSTEFRVDLGGCVTLTTALRRVPRQDLSAIRPMQLRNTAALGDLGAAGPLAFSQDQVHRYLSLSGDGNPIHHDIDEARSLGLPRPIVPGLLLVSAIQPTCTQALPDARLRSLKARFLAPLCVQDKCHVALQSRGPGPDGGTKARAYVFAEDARALAIADLQFA